MGLEGAWRRGLFPGFVSGSLMEKLGILLVILSIMWRLRCSTETAQVSIKKPGQIISKGHKNYDLMLNLQLGIRYSIGKHASIVRDLKPSDFDPKEKFWTRFPPEGSNKTPPHQSFEFRWKDYCPMVFRYLDAIQLLELPQRLHEVLVSNAFWVWLEVQWTMVQGWDEILQVELADAVEFCRQVLN